jgi:hypothetical protein
LSDRQASAVILADKTFFDLSMRIGSGLDVLDTIQSSLAKIFTTPLVLDRLERQIDALLRAPVNAIWRRNLFEMRRDYSALLSIRNDSMKATQEIHAISDMISRSLTPFNRGVDQMELEVLGAAAWLRRNSKTEVLVVSDDSDVLFACHLLSSFLGLVPSILSSFEILRLSSGPHFVGEICDYFAIDEPVSRYDLSLVSISPGEVDKIAHKGFLSIHTVLGPHESTVGMTTRRRQRRVRH